MKKKKKKKKKEKKKSKKKIKKKKKKKKKGVQNVKFTKSQEYGITGMAIKLEIGDYL